MGWGRGHGYGVMGFGGNQKDDTRCFRVFLHFNIDLLLSFFLLFFDFLVL